MKIAVVAANGRSGQAFVKEALNAGHTVRAGIYGTHNLPAHKNLQIVNCDATNLSDIKNLVKNCDAVVSLIGHSKRSPADVQTVAIKNIIEAIVGTKTKLVSLTGTGVRFAGDRPSMLDKFLNFGIKYVDPDRINDGVNHVEIIKASGANWTILRVLKLTNNQPKSYKLSLHGPAKLFTSRFEVAQAIIEILATDKYLKKAPIIC